MMTPAERRVLDSLRAWAETQEREEATIVLNALLAYITIAACEAWGEETAIDAFFTSIAIAKGRMS